MGNHKESLDVNDFRRQDRILERIGVNAQRFA